MALVNGIEYSWNSVKLMIAGVIFNGVSEIEYNDEQEKVNNWGIGSRPVSRSYGKYEAKGKITLHKSEVEAISKSIASGNILDIPPFDVIVAFDNGAGSNETHTLRNVEFMNNTRSMKTGDTKFDVPLDLVIERIDWK